MTEYYKISKETLDDIADTIREMNPNAPQEMSGDEFATYIRGIEDGALMLFLTNTLDKITLSSTIPANCCKDKTFLKEATIVDGSIVNQDAFYGCTNLIKVNGKPSRLNKEAFYNCQKLNSIDLSNVTYIGGYAFRYCYALTEIKLPSCTGMETGNYNSPFQYCKYTTKISIPLLNFGNEAQVFYGCNNLEFLYMPLQTHITSGMFQDCTKVMTIYCPNLTTINSGSVLKTGSKLYLGNVVKISSPNSNFNYYVPTGAKQTYVDAWGSTYESKIFEYNPTFTIDGVEYTSTGGSWTNWLSSSLNTLGLSAKGNNIVDSNGNMLKVGNQYVSPNDYIETYPYVMGV